jgi:hypothetical protein
MVVASPDTSTGHAELHVQEHVSDEFEPSALSKNKKDKAFPETRSLSSYMDDVISEFAAEMALEVVPTAHPGVKVSARRD